MEKKVRALVAGFTGARAAKPGVNTGPSPPAKKKSSSVETHARA